MSHGRLFAALIVAACACSNEVLVTDGGGARASTTIDVSCQNPTPIPELGVGDESGFVRCDDGFVHRTVAVECVDPMGVGDPACLGIDGACHADSDCAKSPYGTCVDDGSPFGCACNYGCRDDADCGAGVCACAGTAGPRARCVSAGCKTTDDCAGGLCGLAIDIDVCGVSHAQLACLTPSSPCRSGADCSPAKCPVDSQGANSPDKHPYACGVGSANASEPSAWRCEAPGSCYGPCG